MSVGNQKTSQAGSKNMSFQMRNLLLLGEISNTLSGAIPAPPGGLASETTLQAVLTAVEAMRDYEVRLVVDSDTPPVTWLEVRYWDAQTGALGAPQYYLPGSTVPGAPVGSISYINQQTLLTQILAELVSINTKFTRVTRTPDLTRITGAATDTVAGGARSVTFANFGNTTCTVLGTNLGPGETVSFTAGAEEDDLGPIAYTASAGNTVLLISEIR